MRVWATGEQQQVLLVSQIESLLLSRLNVSSVHPFPLSSVVDAMSVSPARPAPSVPHALSPAAVALTRVSKSTSAPHSQSKTDSLLSSLPPCSLSSTSSPGSGTLSLSLSLCHLFSCSLALCFQATTDGLSSDCSWQWLCRAAGVPALFILSRFSCYNCPPSLCVGKQLSMLTRAIRRHNFLFLFSLVQLTHYRTIDVE